MKKKEKALVSSSSRIEQPDEPGDLTPIQVAWLAAAVFVVSVGYGALLPLSPGWLATLLPGAGADEIGRHVGFLGSTYAAGIFIGAPAWGMLSDRIAKKKVLIIGLVGFVASLLLTLVPGLNTISSIYVLRASTGFFVAAVIPVVSAVIAGYTPEEKRARRFAWLGGVSLLGVLVGPGLNQAVHKLGAFVGTNMMGTEFMLTIVVVLSALVGGAVILGLRGTMPIAAPRITPLLLQERYSRKHAIALWWLNATVMFVLAGFEVAFVVQGQRVGGMPSSHVAIMLAVCSLTMLGINALLFFTGLLRKIAPRTLMGIGLIGATAGLVMLAGRTTEAYMYWGISMAAAGIGLVLPVISYLSASTSPERLGATMGNLAAAVALGQSIGSAVGGTLFAMFSQQSFYWLSLPLIAMILVLKTRPEWWKPQGAA